MCAQGQALRLKNERDILGALSFLPAPAFVFDVRSGKILACNSQFQQLLGYDRDELIGMDVEKLQPPEHAAQCRKARNEAPPQGLVTWQYVRKDSDRLDVRVHYREVEYADEAGSAVSARFIVVEFWQPVTT